MVLHTFTSFLAGLAVMLPAFLLSLSFHEYAHAFVATKLGDPTARQAGRLTLNPMAHLDLLGLLFLLLFRIGWAKSVPFNYDNFKHPKLYVVLTALAGPLANMILALVMLYGITYFPFLHLPHAVTVTFISIFEVTVYVNVMLGIFNLLPIPPLDGSHIITVFFEEKYPEVLQMLYEYSFFIIMLLFILPQTYVLFGLTIAKTIALLKMFVF